MLLLVWTKSNKMWQYRDKLTPGTLEFFYDGTLTSLFSLRLNKIHFRVELFSLIVEFRWFDENLFLRLTNMYVFKLMFKSNVIGRKAKVTSLNVFKIWLTEYWTYQFSWKTWITKKLLAFQSS